MSNYSSSTEVVGTNLLTAAIILGTLFLLVAMLGSGSLGTPDLNQTTVTQSAEATTVPVAHS